MGVPLYQTIVDELMGKILGGELVPGDKIPRERDLEVQYGVSRITVIRAIRELQQSGRVYRVKGLGTFVKDRSADEALAAKNGFASLVSVVFPRGHQNGAHDILMGVEAECARDGMIVTIHNSGDDPSIERDIINSVVSQERAGLVVFPCSDSAANVDLYSKLLIRRIPVVFIDRKVSFLDLPFVACDNQKGMKETTTHLIERGHRRIGFLCHSIEQISSENERYHGYCEAHLASGLEIRPDLVYRAAPDFTRLADAGALTGEYTMNAAESALDFFLNMPDKVTAVGVVNDLLAIALVKAALGRGLRVPEDLAVTGFDDLDLASHIEVPLTTLRQPFEKIGENAARVLLNQIRRRGQKNGEAVQEPREIRIDGELIVRQST